MGWYPWSWFLSRDILIHTQPLAFITLDPRSQQMSEFHALDVVSDSRKGSGF